MLAQCDTTSKQVKLAQRQALAGLLWTKQFYHYGVDMWLKVRLQASAGASATAVGVGHDG